MEQRVWAETSKSKRIGRTPGTRCQLQTPCLDLSTLQTDLPILWINKLEKLTACWTRTELWIRHDSKSSRSHSGLRLSPKWWLTDNKVTNHSLGRDQTVSTFEPWVQLFFIKIQSIFVCELQNKWTEVLWYLIKKTDKRVTWHHYKGALGLHGNQAGTKDRRRVCGRDSTHPAHVLEPFTDCL